MLSQPVWRQHTSEEYKVFLLDNSISMSQENENGTLFMQAKKTIKEYIQNSFPEQEFILQKTQGSSLPLVPLAKINILEAVDDVQIENKGNYAQKRIEDISQYLKRQQKNATIYIVTDGQRTQWAGRLSLSSKITHPIKFIKVEYLNPVDNVSISNIEVKDDHPTSASLAVTVKNYGKDITQNITLSLEHNQELVSSINQSLVPQAEDTFTFTIDRSLSSRFWVGNIVLGGDGFILDNERPVVIEFPNPLTIYHIQDESYKGSSYSYINTVLKAIAQLFSGWDVIVQDVEKLVTSPSVSPSIWILDELKTCSRLLWEKMYQHVKKGGSIILLPSPQSNLSSYNQCLADFGINTFVSIQGSYGDTTAVDYIQKLPEIPSVEELFLKEDQSPIQIETIELYYYFMFEPSPDQSGVKSLLTTQEGHSLIIHRPIEIGHIMVWGWGLGDGWSSIPATSLTAPFLYAMLKYIGGNKDVKLTKHVLGNSFLLPVLEEPPPLNLLLNGVSYTSSIEVINNLVRIRHSDTDWEPGIMKMINEKGDSYYMAIESPSLESDMSIYLSSMNWGEYRNVWLEPDEVISAKKIDQHYSISSILIFSLPLWGILLLSVLFFLLLEIIIELVFNRIYF